MLSEEQRQSGVYDNGAMAFGLGILITANPHAIPELYHQWRKGWLGAKHEFSKAVYFFPILGWENGPDHTKIMRNVKSCSLCGGQVDRICSHIFDDITGYVTKYFECRSCGAMGDGMMGIMTDMRYPSEVA